MKHKSFTNSMVVVDASLENYQQLIDSIRLLTGGIPKELGNLSDLRGIALYNNQLTGSIPKELGNLSNLKWLDLHDNQLTGTIPQEVLDLRAEKRLENPPYVKTQIPDDEFLLGNNLNLDISENFGDINDNINNYTATGLPGGLTINRGGVISGIPTSEGIFTVTVTAIDQHGNEGKDIFDIVIEEPPLNNKDYQALKALYLNTGGASWSNNEGWASWDFNSPTPPDASIVKHRWHGVTVIDDRVTGLNLKRNQLTGSIPTELGNLSNLRWLNLSNNLLTGGIPQELGNLDNLRRLSLSNNQLTGSIPTELGNLDNLLALSLSNNQLTDSIPTELGSLDDLGWLRLSNNQLTGSIPTELGSLDNLRRLGLHNNRLTGSIPQDILDWQGNKRLENPPYVKTQIPDVNPLLGNDLKIDISENFGDINDNINNYTATGLPGGLTINSQGVISGIPTSEGTFIVTVTAIDQAGYEGTGMFDMNVIM